MSNVSIYGKKWIDLVFEDRNQEYGAYQLRQENPRVTLLALFYGVFLCGGLLSALIIPSLWSNQEIVGTIPPFSDDYIIKVTNLNYPLPPKVEEVIKTTPANVVTNPIEQPINLLSNLVVVKTHQSVDVPTNKEAETQTSLAIQGTVATVGIGVDQGLDSGVNNGLITDSANPTNGNGIDNIKKSSEVDKMPSFPGGIEKFYQYVANNFRNPHLEAGAIVTVLVAFVVEKDGTLSNIKVIRNSGNNIDKEAIRVLSSMRAKWTPGIKNGEKVRTEFTLPIKVKFD